MRQPRPYTDSAALQVEALLVGLAHGEGFAGQGAVAHDGTEQVVLGQGGQQEADRVGMGAQTFDRGIAVDVVDMAAPPVAR